MTQPTNHPNALLTLIVTFLAPTFLAVTGDLTLARMAAIETINDYRARNGIDLLAIAQIIACGLAALGSLSQSMEDDISLPLTLRLRGNAVALNRAAEQNRRVLNQPLRDETRIPFRRPPAPEPEPDDDDDDEGIARAQALLSAAAAEELAAESAARLNDPKITGQTPASAEATTQTSEKRHQEMWAIALVNEAAEITASLPHLPPAERQTASNRAALLGSTANELLTGVHPPPPSDTPRA